MLSSSERSPRCSPNFCDLTHTPPSSPTCAQPYCPLHPALALQSLSVGCHCRRVVCSSCSASRSGWHALGVCDASYFSDFAMSARPLVSQTLPFLSCQGSKLRPGCRLTCLHFRSRCALRNSSETRIPAPPISSRSTYCRLSGTLAQLQSLLRSPRSACSLARNLWMYPARSSCYLDD